MRKKINWVESLKNHLKDKPVRSQQVNTKNLGN
jgi:hypothetical protein